MSNTNERGLDIGQEPLFDPSILDEDPQQAKGALFLYYLNEVDRKGIHLEEFGIPRDDLCGVVVQIQQKVTDVNRFKKEGGARQATVYSAPYIQEIKSTCVLGVEERWRADAARIMDDFTESVRRMTVFVQCPDKELKGLVYQNGGIPLISR